MIIESPTAGLELLLRRASASIQAASTELKVASPEAMESSRQLLERARSALEAFHSSANTLPPGDRKSLLRHADELRESLEAFVALVFQLKAYFESLGSELSKGEIHYGRLSATPFSEADTEVALMDG